MTEAAATLSAPAGTQPCSHRCAAADAPQPPLRQQLSDGLVPPSRTRQQPAAASSSQQQQHHATYPYNWPPAPPVYVTATLDIWPRAYEADFWQSVTWLESMRSLDTWFIVYATINNLVLKTYISRLPRNWLTHLQHFCSLYLAFSIVFSALAVNGGPTYYRWRTALLAVQRGLRFLNVLMDVTSLRYCATSASCTAFLVHHMQRPGLKPLGATIRSLLVVTFIATTLVHTAYLRFSFKLQALVQLAYVCVLLLYMAVPAAHLLNNPYFTPSLLRMCRALDRFSMFALREGVGAPVPLQDACDSEALSWIMVLFMLGFVGFVVPLTIAYSEERRTKLRYIKDELRVPTIDPKCVWDPLLRIVKCAVLLSAYLACVWALVAQFHARAVLWAVPLDWPGTNMAWYHNLVRGGG